MPALPDIAGDMKSQRNDDALNGRLNTAETKGAAVEANFPVADANLASPNNVTYKAIRWAGATLTAEAIAGTWMLRAEESAVPEGAGSGAIISLIHITAADYLVAGKTTKLRLRASVAVNATKPVLKFTVGLYPVTVAGGAGSLVKSFGTVVSGSTVEINEPAASTVTLKAGSDFALPADGTYALGVVTSAKLTASNVSMVTAQLQVHNV